MSKVNAQQTPSQVVGGSVGPLRVIAESPTFGKVRPSALGPYTPVKETPLSRLRDSIQAYLFIGPVRKRTCTPECSEIGTLQRSAIRLSRVYLQAYDRARGIGT
jgi:hypothetical protein